MGEFQHMKVGFIRKSEKPDSVVHMYAIAAQHYGIEFFYFTPERINIKSKTIKALFVVNGNFVEKETPYPDIIDNIGFLRTQYNELYMDLAKACLFCHVSIGGKFEINNIVKDTDYAIETMLYNQSDIERLLDQYKQLVLKPNRSNQAKNIYRLYRSDDGLLCLQLKDNIIKLSREAFTEKFHDQFSEKYIVSPYIKSVTSAGSPLNVRVLMLRGKGGDWEMMKLVPRIGISGTIVANISAGSSIAYAREFFPMEFGDDAKKVIDDIKLCALTLADLIQENYSRLIPLLGFDIGIDRNNGNKPKFFEVNTGAGIRPYELETVEPILNFYKYLYENIDKYFEIQNTYLRIEGNRIINNTVESKDLSYVRLLKIYGDCVNKLQINIRKNQFELGKEIDSLKKAVNAEFHHVNLYMEYLAGLKNLEK